MFADAYSWINIRFLLAGLWITLQVAFFSIIFSLIIGFVLGVLRNAKIPAVSKIIGFVIDTIRNLPLLLIIFFTYFSLPQIGITLNIFWAAVAALTIFESAMISEIVRGGLVALDKGQREAALASGLTHWQTLRYVVLPQVSRSTLPSLVSQLIALIKDTSLATIITLPEMTHRARIIYGQDTNFVIPMFVLLAIIYFAINFSLSQYAKYLQKKLAV